MAKLRVGIAGYGVVGRRRREWIDRHPHLTTVAVCDQLYAGNEHSADGTSFYDNYHHLLEHGLDLLFVSLPNYLAAEVTIAGLDHGLHVFCEKPPGRSVSDIEKVLAAQSRHPQLALKYGFNHRYHDSVREALRLARTGELGKVINARGVYGKSRIIPFSGGWRAERRYSGGGILLDQGIHMVDLLRLFCGEFVEVKSFVANDFWKHNVEDNAYALLRGEGGVVAMLHSSATQWRHRFSLEISLERGTLLLAGILSGSKSYGSETLTIAHADEDDNGDPREITIRYNRDNSWRDEINDFADAVINDKPITDGSAEEALRTMQLVESIYCADPEWSRYIRSNSE